MTLLACILHTWLIASSLARHYGNRVTYIRVIALKYDRTLTNSPHEILHKKRANARLICCTFPNDVSELEVSGPIRLQIHQLVRSVWAISQDFHYPARHFCVKY